MSVAVIGATSLIARALRTLPESTGWNFLDHTEALNTKKWAPTTNTVINCAFDNRLKHEIYRQDFDYDFRLARLLAPYPKLRYVMLSSRMVYGLAPKDGRLQESLKPLPITHYGNAKLQTEKSLNLLLGDRLTVLRLGNIFDLELQAFRQNFFAIALRSLRDHCKISLDICPFVERDFLPATILATQLVQVVNTPVAGVFNIGSGYGTPVGRIAQWLIEGFGQGQLVVTNMREHDSFWLDILNARAAFQLHAITPLEVQSRCQELGKQLRMQLEVQPGATVL